MNNGEDWTERESEGARRAVGYTFRDRELFKQCFTHKSYANAFGGEHNERLEFLGDAVLELAVTERLMEERGADEGTLTELRKQYVSKPALERAEARADLMPYLRHSGGESNLRGKTSSNLFEAVVGGLYLDGGMEAARAFIFRYLEITETENYKTLLQEYVQGQVKATPVYGTSAAESGFVCVVSALGQSAEGRGRSKKTAETNAAKKLYGKLTGERTDR